ncbi:MAG: Cys-rich peptide radical SAM maturase CcpM [Oscillospiraceae bacterium]|nr:Cys-rich peptide radical SAM maturase CcpM [Oscillospiraceae bacterium]
MQIDTIFKAFKTRKYNYVYDRHANTVIRVNEDEFKEFQLLENGKISAEQSIIIERYRDEDLFKKNTVIQIEHPSTLIMKSYLTSRMKQLTLQVTQQCNLRCGYCAYSGIYQGQRTHSNKRMSLETAFKAIDFFLERNGELSEVVIGFYGGEPLLEFELIKECVDYAKSMVEGKRIRFNMTTNGTLLSDDVVDYLSENDFDLSISLDGSKTEHDTNRKFANGDGSFDLIISNVRRIADRYPEFVSKLSFLTTINPHIDIDCTLEYFNTDEFFNDKTIIFNSMNEKSYKGEISYDRNYYMIRNYEYIKMLFSLVGKLDSNHVSPLVNRAKDAIRRRQESIDSRIPLGITAHPGGPCLAGVMRLFVRADGTLFPCERVSEMKDFFVIGTLDKGIDVDKIVHIMNIGKITETECKNCWGLRQCELCASQIEFDMIITKEDKIKECSRCKNAAIANLYELSVLREFGYDSETVGMQQR